MNTEMTLLGRTLHLTRYPAQMQHQSLQAWDAADEYLVEHLTELQADNSMPEARMLILNDDFGALGCWFAEQRPDWASDSKVAELALSENLEANQLDAAQVTVGNTLMLQETKYELILIKIPKTTAHLEHQLIQLQSRVSPTTRIIAAGKAKLIQKSTLALFEKYLGPTTTSLAKKKARLIFCQPGADKQAVSPYPTVWQTDDKRYTLHNHANVFARQQLDIGARLLLQHLPGHGPRRILDLGCGNGVLGLHCLTTHPDAEVIFVDESHMAVESARLNVQENLPEAMARCHFLVSNCLEQLHELQLDSGVDLVLCNPPFHQQNTVTDHIAFQMFKDARRALNRSGELRIIGNRHLDYPQKLKRLFGGYKVVASDRKFSILSAIKR